MADWEIFFVIFEVVVFINIEDFVVVNVIVVFEIVVVFEAIVVFEVIVIEYALAGMLFAVAIFELVAAAATEGVLLTQVLTP